MTAPAFTFPSDFLEKHVAVVGMTGAGKTSTEKLMVEQLFAQGQRVCILDTIKSDWWGLTSSADGRKAGLPFSILGGPRGHMPLHAGAGAAIGRLVADGSLPHSIIDMADFGPGGLQQFFVDFSEALFKAMKGVVTLVIEEAHEIAPKERPGFGGETRALYWAKKLATAGRSKGIRLLVATQRVQKLHNDVLGSCSGLVAHQLGFPPDQKPVFEWLRSHVSDKEIRKEIEESLPSLPNGNGWICEGVSHLLKRVTFPKFKTFDNSATPKDDAVTLEVKTAAIDLKELKALIGDAVATAEENDPAKLKEKIAQLEKQLAGKPQKALSDATSALIKASEQRSYDDGYDEGVKDSAAWAAPRYAHLKALLFRLKEEILKEVDKIEAAIDLEITVLEQRKADGHPSSSRAFQNSEDAASQTAAGKPSKTFDVVKVPEKIPSSKPSSDTSANTLSPTAQRILDVFQAAFPLALKYRAAAMRAGASPRSSAFSSYRKELLASHLVIVADGDRLRANRKGNAITGDPVEIFASKLQPSWAAMLREIAKSKEPMTRPLIARAAGISLTSSGLSAGLSELCGLALIRRHPDGRYELAEELRRRS